MKTVLTTISFLALLQSAVMAQDISISADITLKSPGNPAETFSLSETRDGILVSDRTLPVEIGRKTVQEDGLTRIELTITAEDLQELKDTFHLFAFDILGLRADHASDAGREEAFGHVVDMLLEERAKAKANKDWATSDKIRNELTALGFEIKDGKEKTEWKLNK